MIPARPLWKEILDAQTNKFYYWDPLTNAIRWSIPDSQWRKFRDPKTEKPFYCHVETQQVTWQTPPGIVIPEALDFGPKTLPVVVGSDSRPASPPPFRAPSPADLFSPRSLSPIPTSAFRPSSPTFSTPKHFMSSSPSSLLPLSESKDSSSPPSTSSTTFSTPQGRLTSSGSGESAPSDQKEKVMNTTPTSSTTTSPVLPKRTLAITLPPESKEGGQVEPCDQDPTSGDPSPIPPPTHSPPASPQRTSSRRSLHRRVLSGGAGEKKTLSKRDILGNLSGSGSKSPTAGGKQQHKRILSMGALKSTSRLGLLKFPSEFGLSTVGEGHTGEPAESIPPPPPLHLALPKVAPRLSELPETPVEAIGTPRHPMPTDVEVRRKAPWVRAINDYRPMGDEEHLHITFEMDDVILVVSKPSSEWWIGQVVGIGEDAPQGKFPSKYVVEVDSKVTPQEVSTVAPPEDPAAQFSINNKIREIVSKKKRRFQRDGFNLDLSYITNNVIAMGYPSKKIEGIYRNHMKDVQRFLNENHGKNYKIYNLCSEREYNPAKFGGRVARYPFDDHNPCPFEMIETFCEDVAQWLKEDAKNVIAIHCKAGKGRTGFMVACYLLYSGVFLDADSALRYFAVKRTKNEKGVTIPSQRRYTWYFHELLRRRRQLLPALPSINPLWLESITIRGIPYALRGITNPDIYFEIDGGENKFSSQSVIKPHVLGDTIFFSLKNMNYLKLDWDVKFHFFSKKLQMGITGGGGLGGYERLFHFWINLTFCETDVKSVEMGTLKKTISPHRRRVLLIKSQLDKAIKDKTNKLFPQSMCVELLLKNRPDEIPGSALLE